MQEPHFSETIKRIPLVAKFQMQEVKAKLLRIMLASIMACVLVSCVDSDARQEAVDEPGQNKKERSVMDTNFEETAPENTMATNLSDVEKMQLLADIQSGKRNFDFYACFTEPFWTFYFVGNQVMFVSMDTEVPEIVPLEYPFTDQEETQVLRFLLNSTLWEVEVTKGEGSDGMSEISYPYQIRCGIYEGGGATSYVKEIE